MPGLPPRSPKTLGCRAAYAPFRHPRYGGQRKPLPAPPVPGNTDAERMSNALRMVLTVSKDELLKKEARLKRASAKKRVE